MLFTEDFTLLKKRGEDRSAVHLSPAQDRAANRILKALRHGDFALLCAESGMGRTTILKHVHAELGGVLIGVRHFIDTLMVRRPDAIEQAFVETLEEAIATHETVIVDDLQCVLSITGHWRYERHMLLDAALEAILGSARNRRIVFGTDSSRVPDAIGNRSEPVKLDKLTPDDYRALAGSRFTRIDFDQVHHAAPAINAHRLRRACLRLAGQPLLDTAAFVEDLNKHDLAGNVEIAEVRPVDWRDLKGMDDVIFALESRIALPFENPALAAELRLKPKRGVLLAGPPGTGKTTIGRALAHRLKGKFFLIDGTVVAGSSDFHETVAEIFEAAKKNAPAVVFIDDCDVIFCGPSGQDSSAGFYRYLLTMLDGLESASAERVCVMITAMDVGSLPPALLRSGRIELWLETRLPDEAARAEILQSGLRGLPAPVALAGISAIAAASHGLTGADLNSVIEDAKLAFAHDQLRNAAPRTVEDYFLDAIEEVRSNRRRYRRSKPARMADGVPFGFSVDTVR